jgi:hypothetical protein
MFRRVRRNRLPLLLAATLLLALPAVAQEAEPRPVLPLYGLGDWVINVRLGLFTPLFFASSVPVNGATVHPPQVTLGGTLGLSASTYLTPAFRIGAEVAGSLASDINSNGLFLVPITANAAYVFSTIDLEIPVTVAIGAAIMRLSDKTSVSLLLRPGAGVMWRATSNWSFGGGLEYWLAYEPAWVPALAGQEMLGNFLDITATAVYHF